MTYIPLALLALAASLGLSACSRSAENAEANQHALASRIAIAVTADGFVPAQTRVKVGQPVTLVVTRQVAKTCATDIVIKDYAVNRPLPENQPVEITFTPVKPGPIRYACAMNMVSGELVAE
jgi:plastocyanin domain-containing protein